MCSAYLIWAYRRNLCVRMCVCILLLDQKLQMDLNYATLTGRPIAHTFREHILLLVCESWFKTVTYLLFSSNLWTNLRAILTFYEFSGMILFFRNLPEEATSMQLSWIIILI